MNKISTITSYIVSHFQSNPLVNTLAFEKTQEMDYQKENLYPLVNIDVINSRVDEELIYVDYTITIVEARDIINQLDNDKIYSSNLIDNLNETHAIAVKFINYFNIQNNDLDIDLEEIPELTFIKLKDGALDGVRFNLTFAITNDVSSCPSTSDIYPETYTNENDYFKIYSNKGIIFLDETGEAFRTSEGDIYINVDKIETDDTAQHIGIDSEGKIVIVPSTSGGTSSDFTKYDKTGGTISGSVSITESLSLPTLSASAGTFNNIGIDDQGQLVNIPIETTTAGDIQIAVVNKTGVSIPKGSAVYINGAQGSRATIALALGDTNLTTSLVVGLTSDDIPNNGIGYVVIIGEISGIDTSTFTNGDRVYVSPTVAGGLTNVIPVSPNNAMFVGTVTNSHATQGKIVINITYAVKLDRLIDVAISDASNTQVLTYEDSTGLWKNKDIPYWTAGTGTNSVVTKDSSNIASGDYSIASGLETKALGEGSHSEGYASEAVGYVSHAEGQHTFANGNASHSEGVDSIANGEASHAEGYQTTASGHSSHAEGQYTEALGDYSHAEGKGTVANGITSHSEGTASHANGDYSHSEGHLTHANGEASHVEGYQTRAEGYASHAEGNGTITLGDNAHSEGLTTEANAYASHAEGMYTKAQGDGAHAEGDSSEANAYASHAEGFGTQALGDNSHSEGSGTIAQGTSTHAGGNNSQANGDYSFVHGYFSIANGENSIVLGANITGNTADTTYVDRLNIKTVPTTGTSINHLGIDSTGRVVVAADIRITGGTYNSGTSTTTLTNNSGGTISISGYSDMNKSIYDTDNDGIVDRAESIVVYVDLQEAALKGDPVYISATGTPNSFVKRSKSVSGSTLPALGVMLEAGLGGTTKQAVIFGKVSNVNTSGMLVNSTVYVGVNGGFTNIKPSSNAQPIGTVIRVGGSDGVIAVNCEDVLPINAQADTGVLTFNGMTTATTTTINIGAATGYIVDNETNPASPFATSVNYTGQTGVTVTTRLTGTESFVMLTTGNTITFQNTFPTSAERKAKIWLGKVSHPNSNITLVVNEPDYITSPMGLVRDFYQKINYINDGVYPYANGANLNINITGGRVGGNGINFVNSRTNPNELTVLPGVAQSVIYRTQTGGTTTGVTVIAPGFYDNAGVITAVGGGANSSTLQYVFLIPGQGYIIQYGQNVYNSLTDAITAVGREAFNLYPNLVNNSILIGVIALNKAATNLNNTSQAQFFKADKFGQIIGATAGTAVGTMQTSYNNSLVPQVLVNDTLGAMTWRNGRASNTSNIVEWQNIAGATVTSVNGEGKIKTASSIQVGNDSSTASSTNVGAVRYREDSNNSYMEMSMRTGVSTYAWVSIVQHTW